MKSPLDDSNIAAHGAVVVASADGLRVGVLYDVATKGEAWITLDISKAGSTITGLNRYPVAFAAADAQTIASRASQASLDTVAGYVDTEVAAIKAKTDNLPASPASEATVAAIKVKTDIALPAAAPGTAGGLARVQDLPTAAQIATELVTQSIIQETAGLTGRNQVCRDFTYDIRNNVTSFRLRLYETPEDAQQDDTETGLTASFLITNTLDDRDRINKVVTKKE